MEPLDVEITFCPGSQGSQNESKGGASLSRRPAVGPAVVKTVQTKVRALFEFGRANNSPKGAGNERSTWTLAVVSSTLARCFPLKTSAL